MKNNFAIQKMMLLLLGFTGGMIAVRFIYSGQYRFVFLVWNLFLAWVPFTVSLLFKKAAESSLWKQALLFAFWLLFFPNSLYVITDLIHLEETIKVPLWYDAILLFAAALSGLVMAFISLYNAELFLMRHCSRSMAQALSFGLIMLGSFGVYLGRFLRWNSWDIFQDPFALLCQVAQRFISPLEHGRTWGTTFILFSFFSLLWFIIKKMPGWFNRASL